MYSVDNIRNIRKWEIRIRMTHGELPKWGEKSGNNSTESEVKLFQDNKYFTLVHRREQGSMKNICKTPFNYLEFFLLIIRNKFSICA